LLDPHGGWPASAGLGALTKLSSRPKPQTPIHAITTLLGSGLPPAISRPASTMAASKAANAPANQASMFQTQQMRLTGA